MKYIKTFEQFINESRLNEEVYKMNMSDFRERISELRADYEEDFWNPSIVTLVSRIRNEDQDVFKDINIKVSKIKSKLEKEKDKNKKTMYKMQINFFKLLNAKNIDLDKINDALESIAQEIEDINANQ